MLTNKLKREILDYVEDIITKDADGLYINENAVDGDIDPDDDCIFSSLGKNISIPFEDLHYHCGATKLVIDYGNYVIKIPFTGFYNWNFDDEEVIPTLAGYWDTKNPCEMEIDIYNEATDRLREILLPTIWVGNINNVPIYVQRKIDGSYTNYRYNYKLSNGNERLGRKVKILSYGGYSAIDSIGIYGLISRFGIEFTKFLLEEIDESISDLHTGNYGYLNDNLVIFDYAGYNIFNWTYI